MTIYTVATTDPPTIVCPPWCDISDVHLGDLAALEGFCTHLGSVWIGERGELRVGNCCTPAGELDPAPAKPADDPPRQHAVRAVLR